MAEHAFAEPVAMRSKRPFIIVTRKLPDPIETRMMELFACRLNLDDTPLAKPELIAAVQKADVLVPTVTDRIDAEVLDASGPALKLIASFGTGVDHVDLPAAQRRGIIVESGAPVEFFMTKLFRSKLAKSGNAMIL